MSNPVARDGDSTSHGGVVRAITVKSRCNGKLIITVGAIHICPLDGHGVNSVVTGSSTVNAEGMPVARIGDRCACGAIITGGSGDTKAGG